MTTWRRQLQNARIKDNPNAFLARTTFHFVVLLLFITDAVDGSAFSSGSILLISLRSQRHNILQHISGGPSKADTIAVGPFRTGEKLDQRHERIRCDSRSDMPPAV